jgi:hypothetical protein
MRLSRITIKITLPLYVSRNFSDIGLGAGKNKNVMYGTFNTADT